MSHPRKAISQLDGLRGFAASFVFLHHARLFPNAGLGAIFYFGQEAVILFFLMSGFVIFHSTRVASSRPRTATYFLHRFRRIYPVFTCALLIAYACACIQAKQLVNPEFSNALGNLFMLQDVSYLKRGVWIDTYMGDSPLWSLSYEWWFYMLFIPLGLGVAVARQYQLIVAAAISTVGFCTYQYLPNQLSLFAAYFIIWWAGVELAREYAIESAVTFRGQWKSMLALGISTMLWCLPVYIAHLHHQHLSLGVDPVLQARHFADALILMAIGIAWYRMRWVLFRSTLGLFSVLAPVSYSIYLLHVPVLNAIGALGISSSAAVRALLAAIVLLPICYALEVRLQRVVNTFTNRMIYSSRNAISEKPA